jgi:hypothetical protein
MSPRSHRTPTRHPGRRRAARPRLEGLEPRQLLATFTVVNTADAGPGSLRQAILEANATPGADQIAFAIPGEGPHVIAPTSPLPVITDAVMIDGYTQPGTGPNSRAVGSDAVLGIVLDGSSAGPADGISIMGSGSVVRGLAIRNFGGDSGSGAGIRLVGSGHRVEGNAIGTDASGSIGQGNDAGIVIFTADANTIGGTDPAARNVISGNRGDGILLSGVQTGRFTFDFASANSIQGNLIGTDASGAGPLGNGGSGVRFSGPFGGGSFTAEGNSIGGGAAGAGNVIAFNGGPGVTGGIILSNSIFGNVGLGIDLDPPGPATFPGYPLVRAEPVAGGLRVLGVYQAPPAFPPRPPEPVRLEFFADEGDPSGFGQGRALLGAIEALPDASGFAEFDATLPVTLPEGLVVTATATTAEGGTSEFSPTSARGLTLLDVSLAAGQDFLLSGQDFTITATVTNRGPFDATGVLLSGLLTVSTQPTIPTEPFDSPVPPPVEWVSVSSDLGEGLLPEPGAFTSRLGTLGVGQVATVTLRGRVGGSPIDAQSNASIAVTANVQSDRSEPLGPRVATLRSLIDPYDVALEVGPIPEVMRVGQRVEVPVRVTNRGPATAVPLSFSTEFRSLDSTFPLSDLGTAVVTPERIGPLGPGESATATLIIEGQRPEPGALLRVRVGGLTFNDPDSSNQDVSRPIRFVSDVPVATGLRMLDPLRPGRRRLELGFGVPLDPAGAGDVSLYRVVDLGSDGVAGTPDDRVVPLRAARYDPETFGVSLVPRGPLAVGRFYQVSIPGNGSSVLVDASGRPIDVDGDGLPGGTVVGSVGVGHLLRYRDATGDRVGLALTNGLIELRRGPSGDAQQLRLLPQHRRGTLVGQVRPARPGGDGLTPLPTIVGAERVQVRLPASFIRS